VADGWMTASETYSDGASSTDCRRLVAVNRIASDLLVFLYITLWKNKLGQLFVHCHKTPRVVFLCHIV